MARAGADDRPARPPIAVGARVRVAARYPRTGHVRTPYYLRGKRGEVIRYFGVFFDPTALAAGCAHPPACRLYQVLFDYKEVWGRGGPEPSPATRIVADLYDNWLEEIPR
jgi:nitrile hydratase